MGSRLELHELLKTLAPNVYFQQPTSMQMEYPCIEYHRTDEDVKHANNLPYINKRRYQATVIDRNPETEIPDEMSKLALCRNVRFFTKDGLNHYVYDLYY